MYFPACDVKYTFPYFNTEIQCTTYLVFLIYLRAQPANISWEFLQIQGGEMDFIISIFAGTLLFCVVNSHLF